MKNYDTVLEALNDLRKRGFTYDFNLQNDCIYCHAEQTQLRAHEFHILETHRFENMSDPGENAVVYAIESPENKIKGVLVNAFGIYSDPMSDELIAKFN